ncbi:MAG: hypothetical protein K6B67_05240 [Lachnospiraceae bacterium]|nr:hypothetical protein [Lachnospiraceae bacterium]
MIISSGDISMYSRSNFSAKKTATYAMNQNTIASGNSFNDVIALKDVAENVAENVEEVPTRLKFETLNYLLRVLLYGDKLCKNQDLEDRLSEMGFGGITGNSVLQNGWNINESITTYTYEEERSYNFTTTGTVTTADGRAIDFNVNVGMSESFYQEVSSRQVWISPQYVDPLVINLDENVVNVSDQTFFFDLTGDGKQEELSRLGSGSGFIALDKNGDGIINDGNELFGTKSGDGFADLSEYDLDGNGWIDEADDIFDKLRIWIPGEDGQQECYKLKEKGVGAICLQNVSTDYQLRDSSGKIGGALRRSGMFLMENGRAGIMSHVDLAM